MDSADMARILDPEAWQSEWSTLGEAIQIQDRRERSELYARRLHAAGYALVKLPEMEIDDLTRAATWPIPEISKWSSVFMQVDSRIAINSVPSPIADPDNALALAAALIAAAQHVMEQQS
ncbi:hypothetical protein ACFYY5_29180 [Nocardia elegans]|uniref:AdoMet activation domain-containing protein n=1 Tax=Nocardia elegans TaxID=300029 RepID=A0ABW6TLB8_9NOCA